jgi:hypothetical protein
MEHPNRCLAVTDKGKIAWHNHGIGLAEGFSSRQFVVICLVALAAAVRRRLRLGRNRDVSACLTFNTPAPELKLTDRTDTVSTMEQIIRGM